MIDVEAADLSLADGTLRLIASDCLRSGGSAAAAALKSLRAGSSLRRDGSGCSARILRSAGSDGSGRRGGSR